MAKLQGKEGEKGRRRGRKVCPEVRKVGEKYKEKGEAREGREKVGKYGQRKGEKLAKITRKGRGKREKK